MRLHDASSWREATIVQYSMTENVTDSTSKLYLRREVTHATGAAIYLGILLLPEFTYFINILSVGFITGNVICICVVLGFFSELAKKLSSSNSTNKN